MISDICEQLGNDATNCKRRSVTWRNYNAPQGARAVNWWQAVIM
jgi:hypothetical protein